MKRFLLWSFVLASFSACQNQGGQTTSTESKPDTTKAAPAEEIHYAYTVDHPADNWDRGSQKNVELVLNALKAWETGNMDESLKYFGDSVQLSADHFDAKLSKDSLGAMFKRGRSDIASVQIQMEDFESVISKDKSHEYVGLWYIQKWTDKKGKTDSVYHMDDLRIKDGKIIGLDEKTRHYPAPAKK